MSAAFPESVERAEEVLRHTREVLARADANSGGGGVCDQGREPLTTEVRGEGQRSGEVLGTRPGTLALDTRCL